MRQLKQNTGTVKFFQMRGSTPPPYPQAGRVGWGKHIEPFSQFLVRELEKTGKKGVFP